MVWLTVPESTPKFKVKLPWPLFLNMLASIVIRDQKFDMKTRLSNIFGSTRRTVLKIYLLEKFEKIGKAVRKLRDSLSSDFLVKLHNSEWSVEVFFLDVTSKALLKASF